MTFTNEPLMGFGSAENRDWIAPLLAKLRTQLPFKAPVMVAGKEISGLKTDDITNPCNHAEVITRVSLGTTADCDAAIEACEKAKQTWGRTKVAERAHILRKVADLMVQNKKELIGIIMLEEAKVVREADADVCEAIDFCRYYADEAERLMVMKKTMDVPGEDNHYTYFPRGTCLAVSPWNFPLAILCGMTVAPLVCGNGVIMKPSKQSSGIAYKLYQILIEAGVDQDAVHLLCGSGAVIGDYIVKHPKIHVINFTGSREVGLEMIKSAAVTGDKQKHVKKVIAEMGGKNALIIDDDADLDSAIPAIIHSAFGFSGQKCSALSRLIVHEKIYDKCKQRLIEAMKSVVVGSAEEADTKVGPVIDRKSQTRLFGVIEKFKNKIIAQVEVSSDMIKKGNYVPPTLFEETDFSSDLGQVEFFGPLFAMFKVKDFDEAVKRANDVDYALTGGLCSRSPSHIERIQAEMEVGNLYINRSITGALVCRQPFGGFKLSGVGGKAGGQDYLLHFLEPKTIVENTMRRGFAPEKK